MAHLFVSFPMTLGDLEGHSRDAGLIYQMQFDEHLCDI